MNRTFCLLPVSAEPSLIAVFMAQSDQANPCCWLADRRFENLLRAALLAWVNCLPGSQRDVEHAMRLSMVELDL